VVGVGFMGELVWMGIGGIVSCEGCRGLFGGWFCGGVEALCGGVLVLQNRGTGVYIWDGCCLAGWID
jgi:hypothetical protein